MRDHDSLANNDRCFESEDLLFPRGDVPVFNMKILPHDEEKPPFLSPMLQLKVDFKYTLMVEPKEKLRRMN